MPTKIKSNNQVEYNDIPIELKVYNIIRKNSLTINDIVNMCKTDAPLFRTACTSRKFWYDVIIHRPGTIKKIENTRNHTQHNNLGTAKFTAFADSILRKEFDENINYHKEIINYMYFFKIRNLIEKKVYSGIPDKCNAKVAIDEYLRKQLTTKKDETDLFEEETIDVFAPRINYYAIWEKYENFKKEVSEKLKGRTNSNELSKILIECYDKDDVLIFYKPMTKNPKNADSIIKYKKYYQKYIDMGYKYAELLI